MDLGIAGRWALVCGASRGLGRDMALALAGAANCVDKLWITYRNYMK